MKRAVIEFREGFTNIPADRMELKEIGGDTFLCVYAGDVLAGVFDLSCVMKAHISEKN